MSDWISIKDKLPQQNAEVLIVWVNHNPVNYYKDIKDKPFTGVAWYYNSKWWWWSPDCKDMLDEYGVCPECYINEVIEVTHWMPLPEPPKSEDDAEDGCMKEASEGEWIVHYNDIFPVESTEECSICHAEQYINGNDDNYCPNCGAKMKQAEKG